MGDLVISAVGITKKFGSLTAVDNVGMDVRSGKIYGVAGLNGAGKSTLLAILAGVMRPDGGTVEYAGKPANAASAKKRSAVNIRIGYVPQDIALFPDLTVYDNLKFWALAGSGAKSPDRAATPPLKEYILSVSETAGLSDRLRQSARSLSGGMKQRLNIAAALVADPDILIMDEPTAGLDVKNRRDILNFINSLAKRAKGGLAVVCTSHQPGELETISDRLLLLDRGRTIFDGPPANVFSGRYAGYNNIDDIIYSLGNG